MKRCLFFLAIAGYVMLMGEDCRLPWPRARPQLVLITLKDRRLLPAFMVAFKCEGEHGKLSVRSHRNLALSLFLILKLSGLGTKLNEHELNSLLRFESLYTILASSVPFSFSFPNHTCRQH